MLGWQWHDGEQFLGWLIVVVGGVNVMRTCVAIHRKSVFSTKQLVHVSHLCLKAGGAVLIGEKAQPATKPTADHPAFGTSHVSIEWRNLRQTKRQSHEHSLLAQCGRTT